MKMNKKESSLSFQNIFQHETKLAVYIISCMVVLVLGVSYALFLKVDSNSANQVVTAGDLSFTYKDGSTISSSSNSACFEPMSDDEAGLYFNNCSYQFSAQNSGTLKANYTFKLVDNGSKVSASNLKYTLKKQNTSGTLEIVKSGLVSELADGLLVQEDIATKSQVVYSIQVYVIDSSLVDSNISNAVNYTIDGTGLVNEDAVDPEKPSFAKDVIACGGTASCIEQNASSDTINLAVDDYGNTRYIGANPNNYVSIDGDIWRIIGVMKDIDDGTGNKEDRVKIIRSESIGDFAWDTSASSVNIGYGVNEWSQADLMKLLNPGYESETVGGSLYWNNQSGTCYKNASNKTTSCNFISTGIKDKLKALISDAVWNTGSQGTNDYTSASGGLTKHFYAYERSSNTGKICSSGTYCNDTVERTTTWTGKVGLMYLSDYGYATSGGSTTDRAACLNKELMNWDGSSVNDCKYNDWLFNDLFDNDYQWTILPGAVPIAATVVGIVNGSGSGDGRNAFGNFGVRPVVYLKSNVKISSGTGSQDEPFELES